MTDVDPIYRARWTKVLEAGPDELDDAIESLHARYVELTEAGTLAAVTPGGLPYPLPTDPLTAGADAIRALAEAVDPFARPTVSQSVATYGATTVETIAATINVGVGTWDVTAKAQASWAIGGPGPRWTLRLRSTDVAGTIRDEAQVYIGDHLTGDVPAALSAPGLVQAAAGVVVLTVNVVGPSTGSTVLKDVRLLARRTA